MGLRHARAEKNHSPPYPFVYSILLNFPTGNFGFVNFLFLPEAHFFGGFAVETMAHALAMAVFADAVFVQKRQGFSATFAALAHIHLKRKSFVDAFDDFPFEV